MDIASLRKDYKLASLLENEVNTDPIAQFKTWFSQALNAQLTEPNAMCLSTINGQKPESRIVLLKDITTEGFVFYTNYNSAKGQQIAANNNVCLNFVWLELERQVRIEGKAEKISQAQSDTYFYSRPLGSQIGAIISAQSETLNHRNTLEEALKQAEQQYQLEKPMRPAHWGGYIVKPSVIEFWQGRSNRLHDRLEYELLNGEWRIRRLNP